MTLRSKQKDVVARSSVQIKFVVLKNAFCRALYLKFVLQDLCFLFEQPI